MQSDNRLRVSRMRCSAKRCTADPGPPRTGTVHASRVYPTCAHWAPIAGKPEIGVCRKTGKNRDRTNQRGARVFGSLILRRREAPSRRMRRAIPLPSCFETHRSALRRAKQPALAMLLCMRGKGARRILAKRTQLRFWPTQGSFWRNEAEREYACWSQAKNQPSAVRNDRRLRSIVFRLLFTMGFATRTCRSMTQA
jgi:hypothetical protein